MTRLPLCCMLLTLAMSGSGSAQEHVKPLQAIAQSNIRVPGTDYHVVLGADVYKQSGAARRALFRSVGTWFSIEFDLPAVHHYPLAEFVPRAKIVALRYGRMLSDRDAGVASGDRSATSAGNDVVAVYSDSSQTIYLPEGWTGATPAELSVLVHETVHHVQNLLRLKYECPEQRERLAYLAQERWLGLFNRSLASDFELDPLSLLVKTRCFY